MILSFLVAGRRHFLKFWRIHKDGFKLLKSDDAGIWVKGFLEHPWLRRMWTFQELILSRNPVFLCGDRRILWEDIVRAVHYPETSPAISAASAPWRSLFYVWIDFPRTTSSSQWLSSADVEAPLPLRAIREVVTDAKHPLHIINPVKLLTTALCTAVALSLLSAVAGLAYVLYFVYKLIYRKSPAMAISLISLFALIGIAAVRRFIALFRMINTSLSYTFLGRPWEWLAQDHPSTDPVNPVLRGIWTALAERACTNPNDKLFALSGILGAAGLKCPPPDYSRTAEETFQALMRALVLWKPAALNLVLGAGIQAQQPGWPSWLPNWAAAESNSWLVRRYRLERSPDRTAYGPEAQYRTERLYRLRQWPSAVPVFSGQNLHIQGRSTGTVDACFCFSRITDKGDHVQLVPALSGLARWMWSAKARTMNLDAYRVVETALFAILEGLTPPKRGLLYLSRCGGYVAHPRTKAPYDITEFLDRFVLFETLHTIIGRSEGVAVEAILANIQEDSTAFDYFIGIANKLAREARCLFLLSHSLAGTGPSVTANGDEVFLVPRADTPFLLRGDRDDGTFTFVGGVLVHGLMRGEGFIHGIEAWQDLVIR